MPLPTKNDNETREQFIDRCMSDPALIEEFPDNAQRVAICESQVKAEQRVTASGKDGEGEEPDSVELTALLEIEAAGAETPGGGKTRLPRFSMVAYTGGEMSLGGWRNGVVVDLGGISIAKQKISIRSGHEQRVGHSERIAIENGKLVATGVISCTGESARELVADAANGFPWQASIGASVNQFEFVKQNQTVQVNGREFTGPVNVVRSATLREISFVDVGADADTSITVAAKAQNDKEPDMAKEITNIEADEEVAAPVVKAKAQKVNRDVDSVIASAKAERERVRLIRASIEEAASTPGVDLDALELIEAQSVEEKWPVKDVDIACLRATRPKPQIGVKPPTPPPSQAVLEAAILTSVGYGGESLVHSHGEQVVATAEKKYGRSYGLQELMINAAQANGYTGRAKVTTGNWREVLDWACPSQGREIQATGFSTVDLTGILGSVANKALAAVAAEPVWLAPKLAGVASHSNFHSHTVYSLAMNGELVQVGPTGELPHMAFAEESYTRQVVTRGAVLRVSRTDVINDDLGVFARNAQGLARKAYTTREKALMTAIMVTGAGGTHFTAARLNYLTGATSAFGAGGMAVALAGFRRLTGPDGDPIMVDPALVLVPPTLEDEARRLLAPGGQTIITGYTGVAARTLTSSVNPYAGRFGGAPLCSPWLEVATITGYSTAYWYMFANPAQYPCYEIAYLNGQQTPTVEYFGLESQADTLGMTWRCYWDFGVGSAEWRAGVKLAGA